MNFILILIFTLSCVVGKMGTKADAGKLRMQFMDDVVN